MFYLDKLNLLSASTITTYRLRYTLTKSAFSNSQSCGFVNSFSESGVWDGIMALYGEKIVRIFIFDFGVLGLSLSIENAFYGVYTFFGLIQPLHAMRLMGGLASLDFIYFCGLGVFAVMFSAILIAV